MRSTVSRLVVGAALAAFAGGAGLDAGSLATGPALALADLRVNRAEEEIFLFALQLDHTSLSTTFPGYPVRDGMLIPLGEFCRQLDLAIQTDPRRGVAEGFFIEEKRRFSLDVLAGTVQVEGRRQTFDRSRVELHDDDIYVDTRLLAAWLPMDLKVDRRTATITVTPHVILPLQERWKREQNSSRIHTAAEGPRAFPRVSDPYRMFEVPMVDETLLLSTVTTPGVTQKTHLQSTTFAAGDLLGLSTNLFASMNAPGGPSNFRLAMGRRDPNAGLLGSLQATEFAFGEVLDPGLDLLSNPMTGSGALLTNIPLQLANTFDRHSFQGDLPPGWQVELYRNQALIGFQASRSDGRYEFLNIPLYYGWNDFRLVFYGPQGQRHEEVSRFDVSASQTPAGEFQYRVVGVEPHEGLAGRREQVEGRYGLSKQMAIGFAVSELDLNGLRHTYSEANLQAFWKPLSATLTAAKDQLGGSIAELALRSRLGSTSLTLKHSELQSGFVSEMFLPTFGPVKSRSSIETSTLLPSIDKALVTFDLGGTRDQFASDANLTTLFNRISTSVGGYFFSNQVTRTEGRSEAGPVSPTTIGSFLASKMFRSFSVRTEAGYELADPRRLDTLAVWAETPMLVPFNFRAGIVRNIANRDTLIQLGTYKNEGAYALGVDLGYSTHSRLSLNLSLRLGLAREPRTGRIVAKAQGLATQGAVSTQAFLDTNGNGRKEAHEKPVEGVAFLSNGAGQPGATDAKGMEFITNLPGEADANISVNPSTLEDPLMRPGIQGFRITPRPGHVALVDVPMVVFGEITGTVRLKQDGETREVSGLLLELADGQGKVVKRVRTAYDGFYTLSEIPPGTYLLRVPAAESSRLGLSPMIPRTVVLSSEGTVLDGLDLLFLPAADALKGTGP
jgi:hypothetical protein